MTNTMPRVGLDVHANQTHLCALDLASGELEEETSRGTARGGPSAPARSWPRLLAVYEAGPTGFGLARAARERGPRGPRLRARVDPRAPGDRVKTDRRDADRLARLLAAGELRFAFVPSIADEHFRDLAPSIEDLRGDLMRARHRLSKFLLRRGVRYPAPGGVDRRITWLARDLRFEDARPSDLRRLPGRRRAASAAARACSNAIEQAGARSHHADVIARLRCFRGIDTLSAAGLAAEVGDFGRFAKPTLLAGLLGIVPVRAHLRPQAPPRRHHQGRAPRTHGLLVEAAHHYGRPKAERRRSRAARTDRTPRDPPSPGAPNSGCTPLAAPARADRGKPAGVVAVACARELATFLWEAATLD